jgi:hypothetical protein
MRAARALMNEETFAGSGGDARGCVGLQALWFFGQATWASARRTRSSPGYQITGLQP